MIRTLYKTLTTAALLAVLASCRGLPPAPPPVTVSIAATALPAYTPAAATFVPSKTPFPAPSASPYPVATVSLLPTGTPFAVAAPTPAISPSPAATSYQSPATSVVPPVGTGTPFPQAALAAKSMPPAISPQGSPPADGLSGLTYAQSLDIGIRSFLDPRFNVTKQINLEGKTYLVAPWFNTSSESGESNLQHWGSLTNPSFSDYLMVTDELTKLSLLLSMGNDSTAMRNVFNTIQKLDSLGQYGLPAWVSRVNKNNIYAMSSDNATDASARAARSLLIAAYNPGFPDAERAQYLSAGTSMLDSIIAHNFVSVQGLKSPVTGDTIDSVIMGGGIAPGSSLSSGEMWIGYFPDVEFALLTGAAVTPDPAKADAYRKLAAGVADQFLIAAGWNPGQPASPSFGHTKFRWGQSGGFLSVDQTNDDSWKQGNPSWDMYDAPRALWMGRVLDFANIVYSSRPAVFVQLQAWQSAMQGIVNRDNGVCIEFFPDSQPVADGCGNDFYLQSTAVGIDTNLTGRTRSLVDSSLLQYTASTLTFNSAHAPGLFTGTAPWYALAAGMNLDMLPFTGAAQVSLPALPPSQAASPTNLPSPTASPTSAQASGSYIVTTVEELPVTCTDQSGTPLQIVYRSSHWWPKFTKGNDPSGIVEDRNNPQKPFIGTGMTEICVNPATGGMYQMVAFADSEHNQRELKVYSQPGPFNDYADNGIVFHIQMRNGDFTDNGTVVHGTGGITVPPQPHDIPDYFPFHDSRIPPDNREIRPGDPQMSP